MIFVEFLKKRILSTSKKFCSFDSHYNKESTQLPELKLVWCEKIEATKIYHSSFKRICWVIFVKSDFKGWEREFFFETYGHQMCTIFRQALHWYGRKLE